MRTGLRLTDVLKGVWIKPRSVSSDFARQNAAEFAALASRGLITTHITSDIYGRMWRITSKGLTLINE